MKWFDGCKMRKISLVLVLALGLIVSVTNADYTFGTPTNLGPPLNTSYYDSGPNISADGLSFFFESNRPGGHGSYDIYVTTRATIEDDWGTPVNLGPTVNSSAHESGVRISRDGLELYITSNQPGGYGRYDVWVTTRKTTDDEWSQGRLNPTGRATINKTGHTQFRVYHLPGDNDESTADYLGYYPGEDGAGYAPELIVTYDNPPAPPAVPEDPDDFHGVRTKWKKWVAGTGGATRATIIPGLRGLSVANWVKALEDAGANAATINLEARNNLLSSPIHPTYGMTEEQISQGEYTPDQRNTQLVDFLSAVQAAKEAGQIAGSIKFHVHQRLYPRHDTLKEQQFVDDFSGFIEKAKTYNVDHWLAGIRLGENGISETDLDYTLELSINWATAININTGDWLKTHGMEMSGGYMGAYFNNIDSKPNSATFFQEISQETGYFTFCFKHFIKGGIRKEMTRAGYDKNNVDDWLLFLRYDCGFADLVSFIDSYKASYPMHANCIFIGDSGDAMKQLTDPEYAALTQMFTEADAGFEGIIAVNGYLWNKDNPLGDCYKALHIVDPTGDPPVLLPLSYLRWSTWPDSPLLAVAYWKLDETEGSFAADSAGDNDGTLYGEPLWQPTGGMVDGALELDGIDDYVSTPFVLNPADGAFSVFAWIRGGAPGQVIISQVGRVNWLLADPAEGKLMTELKGTGRFAPPPLVSEFIITDGDWHRIGFVWDGSNRMLYVDDVEVARDTQANLEGSAGGLYIGAGKALEPGSFFSGLIDDVRIYDRAVSP